MSIDRFKVELDGDRIKKINLVWGIEDRPLWKTIETIDPKVSVKWVDRLSSFESIASEWVVAGLLESKEKIKTPERALFLRILFSETQRLLWSYNYLAQIFKSLEDHTRYQVLLRLRELVFETQELLTGSRILPQILCIGGIERDLTIGERKKIKNLLIQLEHEFRFIVRDITNDQLVVKRLSGFLTLDESLTRRFFISGPIGQASGYQQDLRTEFYRKLSPQLEVEVFDSKKTVDWFSEDGVSSQKGDGLSRLRSVMFQIRQSLNLIDTLLDVLPEGDIKSSAVPEHIQLDSYAIFEVEGASGVFTGILKNNTIRILTPSMRMRYIFEDLLPGLYEEDLNLAIASLAIDFGQADLCGSY